ncbi:hypothetical protein V8D89_007910 [Ganoderma adspersum]
MIPAMESSADRRHDWEPRLNFDILHLVCNSLPDVTDVLSFAFTCSALTESAFKRRLRMSPVNLLKIESVDQFHTFIFSNQAARAPFIYGLRLPRPRLYDSQIQDKSRLQITKNRLIALLEAAVHVQYIYLPTSTPEPLFDAVVKLTTVRELRHFAPTLKILDLDDFPLNIPPSSITTPFLEVRSIKLKYTCSSILEPLHVLVRLFPRLDNELVIVPHPSNVYQGHITSLDDGSGFDLLDGLFPLEAVANLTHLTLFIYVLILYRRGARRKAKNIHWSRFVTTQLIACFLTFQDKLIGSIKHLRITYLRIVFHYTVRQPARKPPSDEELKISCGIDARPAAAQFVKAIPTLRYLFLTTYGHTQIVTRTHGGLDCQRQKLDLWLSSDAWQVMPDTEATHPLNMELCSCVELSPEAAERIMDREELLGSPYEENKMRKWGDWTGR